MVKVTKDELVCRVCFEMARVQNARAIQRPWPNAGINLTSYNPPGHPGAFAPKCVPSPRAFAQQKMPGGLANK